MMTTTVRRRLALAFAVTLLGALGATAERHGVRPPLIAAALLLLIVPLRILLYRLLRVPPAGMGVRAKEEPAIPPAEKSLSKGASG